MVLLFILLRKDVAYLLLMLLYCSLPSLKALLLSDMKLDMHLDCFTPSEVSIFDVIYFKDCRSCFEGKASSSVGDFCKDTAQDASYVIGDYDAETQTCIAPDMKKGVPSPCIAGKMLHKIPFANIMSMREPGCKNVFSKCQFERMQCYAHQMWHSIEK